MAYQSKYTGKEIDDAIGKVGSKLDQTGDASNTTVDFADAENRTELSSKDKLSVLIGKVSKWLKGLKNVAFSASYNDLNDTPEPYTLPIASSSTLGGIKIGNNLTMREDGTVDAEAGGGEGTTDYNALTNQPSINGVTLVENKTAEDLGIAPPTKTSQLTNDSNFATTTYVDNAVSNAGGEISNSPTTSIPIYTIWTGSQTEYEAIETLDANTIYNIIEE